VDRASDEEIIALFAACRSARDRLIVLLLSRAGLRRSEAAGLRRNDLHLLPDNRVLGCGVEGAHIHVIRRDNVNGAWAKSRYVRVVPVDLLVVQAIDQYLVERQQCPPARDSDFLLVNLFRVPAGSPGTTSIPASRTVQYRLPDGICTRNGRNCSSAPTVITNRTPQSYTLRELM